MHEPDVPSPMVALGPTEVDDVTTKLTSSTKEDDVTKISLERKPTTFLDILALSLWMGGFHFTAFAIFLVLFNLPKAWAVCLLLVMVTLVLIPVDRDSFVARTVGRFICDRAIKHFPITMIMEDEASLKASTPCVLGIEPHSLLPVGIVAFSSHSPITPLPNLSCGATSTIFWSFYVRHMWGWLGVVPATKEFLRNLLKQKQSIGLIPGGVHECLVMEHGSETVYLQKRRGFVKLAVEKGAPLVPVFIFGQSFAYNWWRPSGKWFQELTKQLRFAPLVFWGLWGSFIPLPTPLTIVMGRPIPTTTEGGEDVLLSEKVESLHKTFVSEMERVFNKYKKQAGYENLKLRIL